MKHDKHEPDALEFNARSYNAGHRAGSLEAFASAIRLLRAACHGEPADLVAREAVARYGLDAVMDATRGTVGADDWRRVLAMPRGGT